MKTFFFTFILILCFLPACSQVNPIAQDVCSITEEICYWANLVCENWIPEQHDQKSMFNSKSELIALRDELKFLSASTLNKNSGSSEMSNQAIKEKLIAIRDELKKMAERQKLCQ